MNIENTDSHSVYDQLENYLKDQIASGQTHEVISYDVLEEFFTEASTLQKNEKLYPPVDNSPQQITPQLEPIPAAPIQATPTASTNVAERITPPASTPQFIPPENAPHFAAPETPQATSERVAPPAAIQNFIAPESNAPASTPATANPVAASPDNPALAQSTLADLHKSLQREPVQQSTAFNEKSRILFLGEYSKLNPDPFTGRSGETLSKMIAAMRLKLDEIYMARVDKSTDPDYQTKQKLVLNEMVKRIQPEAIVILGIIPAKLLLSLESLQRSRGQWIDFNGIPAIPTFSPQYLERNPASKRETWADLQQVMAKLEL